MLEYPVAAITGYKPQTDSRQPGRHIDLAWGVGLTALAWALRLWQLNYRPLWWDEGISIFLAHQSIPTLLADRAGDVHPPFYFLLLRTWVALTGPSDVATRMLSVAFGVLSVPVLYILGRRLADVWVGRLAALLLVLAPFQIQHAQEARMYTLVPLVGLLSTYMLVRIINQGYHPHRPDWATYCSAILAGIYTHYYAVFIPLFHSVFLLTQRRLDHLVLRNWIRSMVAVVVLYLPWLVFIGPGFFQSVAGKARWEADTSVNLIDLAGHYLLAITQGNTEAFPASWQIGGAALFLALAAVGTVHWTRARQRREYPGNVLWVLFYLVVPLVAGFLINLRLPFRGYPRLLSFAAPGYYLLAAAGLSLSKDTRRAHVISTIIAVVLSLPPLLAYYTTAPDSAEDYRPLIREIALHARPDDVLITDFPWQTGYFLSYLPASQQFDFYTAPRIIWATQPGRMEHDLDALMAAHRRTWYPAYQALGGTQGRNIEGYLTEHYYLALDQWFGVTRLLLYGAPPAGRQSLASIPTDIHMGEQIRLRRYEVGTLAVQPGDILPVTLVWQATAPISYRLKGFIHLLDPQGAILAQRDSEPVGGSRPTIAWNLGDEVVDRYGVLIPPDTPSGAARIVVGLYHADTGERLLARASGQRATDHLVLGTVQIESR